MKRVISRRITREKYFIEIAKLVAKRSTCPRASVGAVLIHHKRIVSTGYNGSASGTSHCTEAGCLLEHGHCRRTVHAEMNALLHLEHGYDELILFCTHQPCYQCVKALITVNVKKVFFEKPYKDSLRDVIAADGHLHMEQI